MPRPGGRVVEWGASGKVLKMVDASSIGYTCTLKANGAMMTTGKELVSAFVEERCVVGRGHEVALDDLMAAFQDWLDEKGTVFPMPGARAFGRWVHGETEVARRRPGGEVHYYGIALADEDNYEF